LVGSRITVDEVEQAMRSGVEAGGDTRPRDFALGRVADFERRVSTSLYILAQIGQAASFVEVFEEGWIEGIEAKEDGFHKLYFKINGKYSLFCPPGGGGALSETITGAVVNGPGMDPDGVDAMMVL
jgi:hypothetical protein